MRLRLVAERRRGRVRVDVLHVRRIQLRILQGIRHGEARALAVFRRRGDVVRVAAHAEADELRVDAGAALLRVLELLENDGAAAVASTKPSRSRSHGRLAFLRRPRCAWRAPWPGRSCRGRTRVIAISPPPATITSASPYWMVRMPRPMACVDVVQAVTTPRFGPLRPYLIDRCPAIMLMIEAGTKNGEIFFGLLRLQIRVVLRLDGREAADAGAAHGAAARRIGLA